MNGLLERLLEAPEWLKIFILASATLVSEDLTTISAGIWVAQGTLNPFTALLGCFIGIFFGDGLLYLAGLLLGRPALKLPILRNLLPEEKVQLAETWFEKNGMMVVIACRFIPGTRLPTYFAAGLLGSRAKFFIIASAVAVAIWVPLLVGLSWFFGDKLLSLMIFNEKYQVPVMVGGILLMFVFLKLVMKLSDWRIRRRLKSRLRRFYRWEFWPIPIVYAPIIGYNLWCMVRYRALSYPLVSNPGINNSGFIGESKNRILGAFQGCDAFIAPWLALPPETPEKRLQQLETWMEREDIAWPIFLKPDSGQRGAGVKKVKNRDQAAAYFANFQGEIQAQAYHPGPYEFGVYYVRLPGESKGRVLGLTGKEFPVAAGDGRQTLDELILRQPSGLGRIHIYRHRYRDQLDTVIPRGEAVPLVLAGNHCLGTIFNDASHLMTDELAAKIDEISQSMDGFFIGRYDIRADNLEDFRKGRRFKIIELNGATGEPSHMYDQRHGILHAQRTLVRHYRFLWEIGYRNRKNGVARFPISRFIGDVWRYYRTAQSHPTPD
ncbi:DedA family protein [Acanthopleuribacter pedis]|uniref:VTT domain-containing protein n=1 Tax=Acanthopleuribacter pedis TaxID=442870 RepID=A0A8J7QCE4_9BACT|nr:DedA family protein [Acanthopleuribacter pedis]MBO1321184.1 VTT domain-containing protein [Acanthopleuribacter pedis]